MPDMNENAETQQKYFGKMTEEMKEVTKVKVTMEVEVMTDEIDLFHTSLENAVIEFSKNTGANVMKVKVVEK